MDSSFDQYTQGNRLITISSPLGTDVLLLESLNGKEGISQFFQFELKVLSKRTDLTAQDIVGQSIDIQLQVNETSPARIWNGLVTQIHAGNSDERGLRVYELTVRPFLWLLTQTSDCRIVHGSTSQDITMLYLKERGFQNVRFQLVGALPVRDYSVQYNETAFTYLTRLWEEDGLFWWFEHEAGKHTLVVTNSSSAYTDGPNPTPDYIQIPNWQEHSRFIPGQHTGQDWNFEQPQQPVSAGTPSVISVANNTSYELYEYPGRVSSADNAQVAANLRMQAIEADYEIVSAQCHDRTLAPGLRFTPQSPPGGPVYQRYVVTKISHTAYEGSYDGNAKGSSYGGSFVAIPARLPATPYRATPRPRIDGVQMAVVVGPPGEEIHTDNYGRILVRFPWDRRGDISCWLRVVQPWGGSSWGAQVIPRVGMEVAIAFQEGDPDRPMCIGAMVNPSNLSAYPLPGSKTRMVFRSKTYKGAGYNEFSMEDSTGSEEYFMHAQKDMNAKILNNFSSRVDANAIESVGFNKGIEVDNNLSQVIGGDMSIAVGPSGKGQLVSPSSTGGATGVGASASGLGNPASAPKGTGNLSVSVQKNMNETVLINRAEKIGQNKDTNVGQNHTIEVGQNMNISVGQNYTVEVGKTLTINATDKIILQSGQSQIVLQSDGTITINGKAIEVSGSASVTVKSDIVSIN